RHCVTYVWENANNPVRRHSPRRWDPRTDRTPNEVSAMPATLPEASAPQPAAPELEVSIVMPCLNEARTVGTCAAKAVAAREQLGVRGEVVVADNGSTDGSQEIATAKGARVVNVSRRGYGSALQAGIAAARGTYVIMGDADDSYDFSNIEPFITK